LTIPPKKVVNADAGDADHVGGNDWDDIADYMNNVDKTGPVKINTRQYFRSGKLELRNPADTFSYVNVASAIAANRNVTEPLLTGDDTRVYEAHTQTLSNKTLASSCNLSAIKIDDLAAGDDNTDLNVSTSKHGLTPKLPNDATKYLDGTGAYTVPPSGAAGAPTTSQYVTLATDAGLSAERVLTAGDGMSQTDAGANGAVTYAQDYIDLARKRICFIEDCFNDPSAGTSAIFDTVVSGTGAAVTTTANTETGKFGLWSLSTGTTTTGAAAIVAGNLESFAIGQGQITIEFLIKFPLLSTSGEEYTLRCGLIDANSGTNTDAVTMYYNRFTSGDFWGAATTNNTTSTTSASNTAVVASTWYRCKIVINAAGTSASYFVNGTELNVSPIATNLPGSSRYLTFGGTLTKTAGTTARTAVLDYYAADIDLTSSR